jgi:hypothetical protein
MRGSLLATLTASALLLTGCGGGDNADAPSEAARDQSDASVSSTAAVDVEPTTITETPSEPAPTTADVEPTTAPTDGPTETSKAAVQESEQPSETEPAPLSARALELRDRFRADHESAVGQLGEQTHCYDDETAPFADGAELATCFLANGGGIVLFIATEPQVSTDDLALELMNSEVPYTTCVGEDYVIATPSMDAADMVFASGFDCGFP